MSAAIQLTLPGHQPHLPPFERFTPLPRRAIRDRHLTDFDRTVLALLIDLAGPKGLTCTATNAALARELGTCEQAIRVSLARLEAAGYGCRVPDRCAGLAHRRVDFLFRTWDKALNPEGGRAVGRAPDPPRRRAVGRAPGAPDGAPQAPSMARPPFLIGSNSNLELKPSENGLTVAPLGPEEETTEATPQVGAAPPSKASAEATPEQIADFQLWATGRLGLMMKDIGIRGLRKAGLEPPPPGPIRRPDYLEAPEEPQDGPRAPEEPATADPPAPVTTAAPDAPGAVSEPPGDAGAEDSPAITGRAVREGPRVVDPDPVPAPSAPSAPQAPPARPPLPDHTRDRLAASAAFHSAWALVLARATQLPEPTHGARSSRVVAEDLLRAFAAGGSAFHLQSAVNCLSAHWRDWKKESRDFWASALAEIRTGVLTVDVVVSLLCDAERKEVKSRSHYFSRNLGQVLAQERARRRSLAPAPGGPAR